MVGYKMEHFRGMTYDKVRPIFEMECKKVQTLFKLDKDVEEPTKKRVAEETLLQESFKKLKAVEVSENDYPLSNGVITLILSEKLQVEEDSNMARSLVMKIFMEANKPKSRRKDDSDAEDSGFELTGFSNADHVGCEDTFMSTSVGAQFLGEKLVSWSSKKQDCTAMSTAKTEYVSLSACCAQVLWMQTQLTDYGFHFNKIPIYYDLKSAIAISCNPVQHSRTKHIAVRYHFIKEHVEKGTIELYFVKMDYQLADLFTKSLPVDRFNYLVRRLGMRSLSPQELERLAKSQTFRVILFSIHSDEWKSFQSQHQTALRIRRWRYNLIPAESKFKTSCSIIKDKYMMKAQYMLRGRLFASFQDLEHEGGDTRSQGGIRFRDKNIKIQIQDHKHANESSKGIPKNTRLLVSRRRKKDSHLNDHPLGGDS
nr:retrovirus-related Pol polyprotein from transposon TNT 1-94 [Tanacetum cinerariifolium]